MIRKPAVAGLFYEVDPDSLTESDEEFSTESLEQDFSSDDKSSLGEKLMGEKLIMSDNMEKMGMECSEMIQKLNELASTFLKK